MKRVGFFATFLFLLSLIGVNPLIGQRTDKVIAKLVGDQIKIKIKSDLLSSRSAKDFGWRSVSLSWKKTVFSPLLLPKGGVTPTKTRKGSIKMISSVTQIEIVGAPLVSAKKRGKITLLIKIQIQSPDAETIREEGLCKKNGKIFPIDFFYLE